MNNCLILLLASPLIFVLFIFNNHFGYLLEFFRVSRILSDTHYASKHLPNTYHAYCVSFFVYIQNQVMSVIVLNQPLSKQRDKHPVPLPRATDQCLLMQVLRIKFLFGVVLDGLPQSLTSSQLHYHAAFLEYQV